MNKKVFVVCTVGLLLASSGLNAFAKSKASETDEFISSIESIGGKTLSTKNEVTMITKTNLDALDNYVAPKELSELLTKDKLEDDSLETITSDETALSLYKEEKDEAKRQQERNERVSKCSWLLDYGIDPSGLSDARLEVLNLGYQQIGIKYVWGGKTPEQGFDCSGFTRWLILNTLGYNIGNDTYEQRYSEHFVKVPIDQAIAGDIVFNSSFSHTGIFISDNGSSIQMLHAPHTGDKVKIGKYSKPSVVYRYIQ